MKRWHKQFLAVFTSYTALIIAASFLGDWRYRLAAVLIGISIVSAIALAVALKSHENTNHNRTIGCGTRVDPD